MCEHVDKQLTFRGSQLENGDIICFQKPVENTETCCYPDGPSFLEYVHNLQVVRFRSLEKPKEDEFSLELLLVECAHLIPRKRLDGKACFEVLMCIPKGRTRNATLALIVLWCLLFGTLSFEVPTLGLFTQIR